MYNLQETTFINGVVLELMTATQMFRPATTTYVGCLLQQEPSNVTSTQHFSMINKNLELACVLEMIKEGL
jgi:hypothetical protein